MNLAIGALLVAILLLPGIIFRYLYIRSDALRKTIDLSLLNEVVFILTPSLLLHLAGQGVAQGILSKKLDLKTLYLLLTGNGDGLDFSLIEKGFPYFVLYILTLCVVAGFLGIWLQKIVVRFGWDERYKILRIYNDWDKYFSGAVLPKAERKKIDFVQVDVVVQSAKGDVLYTGVLENYTLNKDQGIDRLFLSNVYRREFSEDLAGTEAERDDPPEGYPSFRVKDFDDRYYALPGAYFVIPFGEIRNLNISYNTLVEVEG
jgi:hypothetical protein